MMRILTRRIRPVLRVIAIERFEEAKSWLQKEIMNHPITQDLNSHSTSPFVGGSATGTLYGFIGFNENDQPNPVEDLLTFLDERISYSERQTTGKLFSCSISVPSKQEFNEDDSLVVAWTGKAWPLMIEDGISGLGNYLNIPHPNSESGEGIQVSRSIRGGDFGGAPYLTPLFEGFRKKLLLK